MEKLKNLKLSCGNRLIILLFIAVAQMGYSQTIYGPTPVPPSSTHTYEFSDGNIHNNRQWVVSGGTSISETYSKFPTTYKITITWGVGTSGAVTFKSNGFPMATLNVSLVAGSGQNTIPSNRNYIHTITPTISTTDLSILDSDNLIESITYFDAIGRPEQKIGIRHGGNKEDIVTHMEYDSFDRQAKDFLPFASNSNFGSFVTNGSTETNNYYSSTAFPYSQKQFEPTPLNRIQKQSAPGDDWRMGGGHEIEMEYDTNIANEVMEYKVSFVSGTYNSQLNLVGAYGAGELYKTTIKDENHSGTTTANTTEEFKDSEGRVILKRTYADAHVNGSNVSNVAHDTYYVYDRYGNLTYVLPPLAEPHSSLPSTTVLSELCYQYTYDERNRLVEKKLPGKGVEYIVYNKLDQPILSQTANQRTTSTNSWTYTKYDAFGRIAYTGKMSLNGSRSSVQSGADGATTNYVKKIDSYTYTSGVKIYYSNEAYPTSGYVMKSIYTINYYDDYTFDKNTLTIPSSAYGQSILNYNNADKVKTKGLLTGSKVNILTTNAFITSIEGYEKQGKVIFSIEENPTLATKDTYSAKINFMGLTTNSTNSHVRNSNFYLTTFDDFEYDQVGRPISQIQSIDDTTNEIVFYNTYNDIGQLIQKGVGGKVGSARLQTIDYTYNIRGWLTGINDVNFMGNDLFAEKINYNQVETGIPAVGLYNGNISEVIWKTQNDVNNNPSYFARAYAYVYDAMNRIKKADYRTKTGTITYTSQTDLNYNVSGINYDKNGNIQNLSRYANTGYFPIDNLTYTYSHNKLLKVTDNASATYKSQGFNSIDTSGNNLYEYDGEGNMNKDLSKGIGANGIEYNHLGLTEKITKNTGSPNGNIVYLYDANGNKLRKTYNKTSPLVSSTDTDYVSNLIYQDGILQTIRNQEGFAEVEGSGYNYIYQHKDHLGNVRLTYMDNNRNNTNPVSLEILVENNYYPFGLKHTGYNGSISPNSNTNANRFKFNGVEFNEDLGPLNLYEMPMRQYDPALGRFMSIDPVIHFSYSTYSAFDNNPVYWADPSGANSVQEMIQEAWDATPEGGYSSTTYGITGDNSESTVEPITRIAGTAAEFLEMFNNTPSKMGTKKGKNAEDALISLGSTEWSWKQFKPLPNVTPYFNNRKGRYIYTEKGGWIDMVHFLFYAGKAYGYLKDGNKNPVGEAMQDGYKQEALDPEHSSYSYEDLPSDRFGAVFATQYFNPSSDSSLGQQIQSYLNNVLGATVPTNAPNYQTMPTIDTRNPPSKTNKTTTPIYTKQ